MNELIKEGVRLRFLGDLSIFDADMQQLFEHAQQHTQHNDTIQLNVMLNYGGRREIVEAVQSYADDGGDIAQLTEDHLSNHMYTRDCGDPDI